MVDDNNKNKVILIRNIVVIVVFLVLVIVLFAFYRSQSYSNRLEKKLIKEGYEQVTDKIYSKDVTDNGLEINYVYNLANNEFTKSITNSSNNANENISLLSSNNVMEINYIYNDANGCQISQTGKYNKENFECNITSKTGSCQTKCDVILEYAKEFSNEIKTTIN